jgi:NADPH:quinone reductase-like Zn-dependent oxidoreductase
VRAAVLQSPGSPPSVQDHPDPEPGQGQSMVRVTAAPLVPLDLLCASGTSYFGRPAVPYVPGVQGVGVVERSNALPPGTKVWFATSAGMAPGDGSLAEFCCAEDGDLVPLHEAPPDPVVAALGLSAVAAWMSLTWRGRLRQGERVVVLGAGGAVGQVAIGAARLLQAARVVGVCRSSEAAERGRAAGADEVILVDDVEPLVAALAEAVGGQADLVIDPVFGGPATAASRVLATNGRLVNLGGASGDMAEFSSAVIRSRNAEILGYTNNLLTTAQREEALRVVVRHASAGLLAVAHEAVPLSAASAAWGRQAAGGAGRRLVLTP